jgi:hypothetical protein
MRKPKAHQLVDDLTKLWYGLFSRKKDAIERHWTQHATHMCFYLLKCPQQANAPRQKADSGFRRWWESGSDCWW